MKVYGLYRGPFGLVAQLQSGAKNCTSHQSTCIVDHLVAHCQSVPKYSLSQDLVVSSCIVDHLVAQLQSGAKNCTNQQSACIVDHLVVHFQSGAKSCTFHQFDCVRTIWWPTDNIVPKCALSTIQPVWGTIWWPTDNIGPKSALFTSLTV